MTLADLTSLAGVLGAADIPELFNKFIKNVSLISGKVIEINTDFDYRKKEIVSPIYYCAGVTGNLIRLVPANDYAVNRHFNSLYVDAERLATVMTFDQTVNKFRQEYEAKLKTEIAEGKFVNRDTGRIIGADEPERIRTYPSEKE
jgi:hypothetical protein